MFIKKYNLLQKVFFCKRILRIVNSCFRPVFRLLDTYIELGYEFRMENTDNYPESGINCKVAFDYGCTMFLTYEVVAGFL